MSVSLCRFTSETAEPIELRFGGNLPLGPAVVLGYKLSGSVHGFAGNPGKTDFYSSIYLTLYYRKKMSSIYEMAKPIKLKFCKELPLGPGTVLTLQKG